MGSGSSRIAAYEAGLDYVGCEINKTYFDMAQERFERYTAQTSLFVAPQESLFTGGRNMKNEQTMERVQTILTCLVMVFAVAAVIVGTHERKEFAAARDSMEQRIKILTLEKEYAAEREAQWHKQYEESVFEIAALKEEIESYCVPLEEPPADAYDAIGWDFDYVVRVVGAEARGESMEGILAVCQCIADTADRTGMTPEEVVKQPNQYSAPVSRDVKDGMERVNEACCRVFLTGERPYEEPIEYFYAYKNGYSAWHESKVYCFTIGGHRYFKQ